MTENKFRIEFGRRGGRFSPLSPINTNWKVWYDLLDTTKTLDYGCNFNEQDVCEKHASWYQKSNRKVFTRDTMCCCVGCCQALGYLDLLENEAVKNIARYFTETKTHGFWRPGKGCILPRKYRSGVCIGFFCGDNSRDKKDMPTLTEFERTVLLVLRHHIRIP
jgi:hypothetical protein